MLWWTPREAWKWDEPGLDEVTMKGSHGDESGTSNLMNESSQVLWWQPFRQAVERPDHVYV